MKVALAVSTDFYVLACPMCNYEFVELMVLRDEEDRPYIMGQSAVLKFCPRCGEHIDKRFD